jgi:hypothetical protein
VIAAYQRDVFKDLGWVPVNVQIPELYEALSRGVIEGIFMATAANVPMKWHEIGKVHLQLSENTMVSAPLAFNMNVWNRLPVDVQKVFMEAAWETAQWSVQQTEMNLKGTYKAFEDLGNECLSGGGGGQSVARSRIQRRSSLLYYVYDSIMDLGFFPGDSDMATESVLWTDFFLKRSCYRRDNLGIKDAVV